MNLAESEFSEHGHIGSLEPNDNSYLKRVIIEAMVKKGLIDMPKPSLIYSPADRGEG